MFDAGFWELALILIIGLLVVGPEKLPKVATTVGRWVGKVRRFASQVQRDLDKQIALEDQQKLRDSVEKMRQELSKPLLDAEPKPTTSESSIAADKKPDESK